MLALRKKVRTVSVVIAAMAALLPVGVGALAQPAAASSCYVRGSDHALFCGNVYNASIKLNPSYDTNGVPTPTVDYLRSTFSYFKCYTTGQRHSGGNNIWYRTYGDVTGRWGYVAAAAVFTPIDPFRDAHGTVAHC
jgi:hypothetical protein